MNTRYSIKSLVLLLLFAFTLFVCFTPAFAAEDHFIITGEYHDSFQLRTNNMHIFEVKDCVPGDSWESEIEVKNLTGRDMEIAIISIESLIEDVLLYNGLNLTIMLEDTILYQGIYGETEIPVTDYFTVPANDSITFDVFVAFPEEANNQYQGTELNSLWTFEARHPGFSSGYTPEDDSDEEKPEVEEDEQLKEDEPVLPEKDDNNDVIIPGTSVEPPVEPELEKVEDGIKTGVDLVRLNTLSITVLFLSIFAFYMGWLLIRKAGKQ